MKRFHGPAILALLAAATLCSSPSFAVPSFNTKENGVRLSSAAAQALTGTCVAGSFANCRLYAIRKNVKVVSALTGDGLSFVEDAGVRLSLANENPLDVAISSITGLAISKRADNSFRMLYSVISTTQAFRIYSATSTDGSVWSNDIGTPTLPTNDGQTFAQFPSLVQLDSSNHGYWRLYYIQNTLPGSNQPSLRRIYTALSKDEGQTFEAPSLALDIPAAQVSAAALTDGRVRLYYTAPPSVSFSTEILSAVSTNDLGTTFTSEKGVRLSTGGGLDGLSMPFVARSTESATAFRWRLFYNFTPFLPVLPSTADVFSAATDAPDPQSVSPSVVLRTQVNPKFTIKGEIFDPDPRSTVSLVQGSGTPILGTSESYTNDEAMDFKFQTLNQSIGFWDLVVTNSNGQSKTLKNAVYIDFPGGSVKITDNLFRPLSGQKAQIEAITFNDGQITAKLYTIDGRPIATLLDGNHPAGTTKFFWPGTTSQGNIVASGVYVLRVTGPKLDVKEKIIVIK